MIGRQIQALDRQIDALVYGLYGLSEDEIKVVEGNEPLTTKSDFL
jgi:hypothetical protein